MDDDPAEMVDRVVPLQDVADLDSMDVLNLVSALADATGLEIPERDDPRLISIHGMVAYVRDARVSRGTR
jgi:acyl carrier protein